MGCNYYAEFCDLVVFNDRITSSHVQISRPESISGPLPIPRPLCSKQAISLSTKPASTSKCRVGAVGLA